LSLKYCKLSRNTKPDLPMEEQPRITRSDQVRVNNLSLIKIPPDKVQDVLGITSNSEHSKRMGNLAKSGAAVTAIGELHGLRRHFYRISLDVS
jgi:hypothetical protein